MSTPKIKVISKNIIFLFNQVLNTTMDETTDDFLKKINHSRDYYMFEVLALQAYALIYTVKTRLDSDLKREPILKEFHNYLRHTNILDPITPRLDLYADKILPNMGDDSSEAASAAGRAFSQVLGQSHQPGFELFGEAVFSEAEYSFADFLEEQFNPTERDVDDLTPPF